MQGIDRIPSQNATKETRDAFAALSPDARAAAYLASIRKMLIFFTVVTVISLIAGFVIGVVGAVELHHANQVANTPSLDTGY